MVWELKKGKEIMELEERIQKAMGFKEISDTVNIFTQRIYHAELVPIKYRGLLLARIAKAMRRERFISVCCVCGRYLVDGEWIKGSIPPGIQSHTYCRHAMRKEKSNYERQGYYESKAKKGKAES